MFLPAWCGRVCVLPVCGGKGRGKGRRKGGGRGGGREGGEGRGKRRVVVCKLFSMQVVDQSNEIRKLNILIDESQLEEQ